jgi:hypothetical protein
MICPITGGFVEGLTLIRGLRGSGTFLGFEILGSSIDVWETFSGVNCQPCEVKPGKTAKDDEGGFPRYFNVFEMVLYWASRVSFSAIHFISFNHLKLFPFLYDSTPKISSHLKAIYLHLSIFP